MPTMTIMNPYVGMANAVPDSRMPRRFSAVSTATAATATPTLCSADERHDRAEVGHARTRPTPPR